ncbi:reverse transcriptase domain-containing protein [Hydrogenimonas sp. SS33]|uniref:reverse transcriptase domain-containing protein n=1 Tax=Hydrogenimonas leucolamina TaxID=2954236 RepID=UPI00336BB60B
MNELEIFYNENKKLFEWSLHLIRHDKYQHKQITKKSGDKRNLNIPPIQVKITQKKLCSLLNSIYIPSKSVHGFIKSNNNDHRTIYSNAKVHIKKRVVINIDISNFFDSINFGRVRGMFLKSPFNLNKKLATKFAQLTTYNNSLPQGAPTSPVISNIICRKMDHELIRFARQNKLIYTRYADDLTFSTNKEIDETTIINSLEDIIISNGFAINSNKTRVQYSNQSQIVTGLKVNRKVNVSRKYIRTIRSMLYSWLNKGLENAAEEHFTLHCKQPEKYKKSKEESFKNSLLGKINFLSQIRGKDDAIYLKYLYTYYLIDSNFILNKKLDFFEKFELYNITQERANILFNHIYDSILIFTEGITDIIYIKEALKFFQNKSQFLNLKLRFAYFGGYADLIKIHRALYDDSIKKTGKLQDIDIANIRHCLLPYVRNDSKFCFVLDADDPGIINYFKKLKTYNHFLIDIENQGYIEKLVEFEKIKTIIKKYGYKIDINRTGLKKDTKKKLEEYLQKSKYQKYKNISAVSNYIAYGQKILEKTFLAKQISKTNNVDYSKFENLFKFLEKLQFNYIHPKKLCCNSIY